jgi:hypothetical protein
MSRPARLVFLLLVLVQMAHSVEEYVTRLYEVFAPARRVSGLVSDDLAIGFIIVNAAVVVFGVWCWAVPVRRGWPAAVALAWGWSLLELGNGAGHLLLALRRGGYFPGAITAPFLLLASVWLAVLLMRQKPEVSSQ